MVLRDIVIKGAREHNLRDIDLKVPRNSLITITGVSGSGKSSLAFDTLFKEGQRRFVESLSTYARQFLGRMEKPRVDYMEGLSPTLSIDQHSINRNPRSTVGTITEIYDCFRLQYARIGIPHCPECGREVAALGPDRIVDRIMEYPKGTPVQILAPVVRERKGEYRKELAGYRYKGFVRARIDGEERRLDEEIILDRYKRHSIELVLERVKIIPERRNRVSEAVQAALEMADGLVNLAVGDDIRTFSSRLACPDCDVDIPEMEPRMFSFNSPQGACPDCHGLGVVKRIDEERLILDPGLSINQGALRTMTKTGYLAYSRLGPESLAKVAKHYGFSLDQPWSTLSEKQQRVLLHGSGEEKIRLAFEWASNSSDLKVKGVDNKPIRGIIPTMEEVYRFSRARHLEKYFRTRDCSGCQGRRLRPESLSVTYRGRKITDMTAMTVEEALVFYEALDLEGREAAIARDLRAEVLRRLSFLMGVGLGYLRLDRSAATLSGGEAQRVRLAAQVGSGLQGVVYVLDEPSIGLHQRDNEKLIQTLKALRDRGNTVFVVEHDREMMLASDHLVDLGPGAGRLGGEIVAEGPLPQVIREYDTATTDYLTDRKEIPLPLERRALDQGALLLKGACHHNLKSIDLAFPLKTMIAVTGVSGSGKSSLILETLVRALRRKLGLRRDEIVGKHKDLTGWETIERVIDITQSPIGRTPRSNPATYTKVFGLIRDIFANCPEARTRGYDKGRFSFNKKGGRCEACGGAGTIEVEMQFLANVEIPCEACGSRRYNRETLEILFRGRSIGDVLEMSVDEAAEFFQHHPQINQVLKTLLDVGLGYMTLGQPSTTLSGGEAQRVKLASELCRPSSGKTLYVLDEPTTGLHFDDIAVLLCALNRLVDQGNTMIIIEHNLDVIKVADLIIDLGPEGGEAGGRVVAVGTPEEVAKTASSATGKFLQSVLRPRPSGSMRKNQGRKKKRAGQNRKETTNGLVVQGARKNNLKSIDVEIPHNALTVITGVSGSGKSSLAFDTLFAEGQRRFVESLSTYARRFLSRLDKVPLDNIEGLAPAIAIDQRSAVRSPRSTVATATEIHDYQRLLFARVGRPHCPLCGDEIRAWSPTAAAADLRRQYDSGRFYLAAPLFRETLTMKLSLKDAQALNDFAAELRRQGFLRVLIDGREFRLDGEDWRRALGPARAIDLVVDRVSMKSSTRKRLAESLEIAFQQGHGAALAVPVEAGEEQIYLEEAGCLKCNFSLGELTPRMFSFNSHKGACPECEGIGVIERCVKEKVIVEPGKPLLKGALPGRLAEWAAKPGGFVASAVDALGKLLSFDPGRAWSKLPVKARKALLYGEGVADHQLTVTRKKQTKTSQREYTYPIEWFGILGWVTAMAQNAADGWRKKILASLMEEGPCDHCGGGRLKPEVLAVTVGGLNIQSISSFSIVEAIDFFQALRLEGTEKIIGKEILKEILNRLGFLSKVGLGYLTLDRSSGSLSGGEAQRIRLASQLGNRLVGVLYVLDEPTIGLHPGDVQRLLKTLTELRDLGNTVVMVEHDRACIDQADHLIDLGPGAGHRGGEVVYSGPPQGMGQAGKRSLTARYFSGDLPAMSTGPSRVPGRQRLGLRKARRHNLKNLNVDIPLGCFVGVTGVSGSGKSTLIMDLLRDALAQGLKGQKPTLGGLDRITGVGNVDKLVVIDQSAIGRTPASNAATYTKVFDPIRTVFATTPEARMRGFKSGHFSFNTGTGRCPACRGRGEEVIEMHFLSDVTLPCGLCRGRRYNRETLAVQYRGASIGDVLEMEITEAAEFFVNHKRIKKILDVLVEVGLGYLKLGQSATTLSGGEAQRVKLASELCRPDTGRTVYLLDEPTTGLHFDDVRRLIRVLQMLVERKNTVVVIEHNLDLIASADHIIDLGPEGGDRGGMLVAEGAPQALILSAASLTGRSLKAHLRQTTVQGAKAV